jgi:hypothetical protein
MSRQTGKQVGALMQENAAVVPIRNRCAALSRLQQSFADALPPGLKDSCRVATMEGSTLIIAAASGASAARLKQMLPRVLQALRNAETDPKRAPPNTAPATRSGKNEIKEQQVTAISVVVQPSYREVEPVPPVHGNRTAMPEDKREELLARLAPSPLKDVLQRQKKKR